MYTDFLIPIFLFGGTAAVLWKYFDGRHKERMGIIEKGLNPVDYKELYKRHMGVTNPLTSLKWGLLFTFVGVGLFVGLSLNEFAGLDEEFVIPFMLIAGGIALMLHYRFASRKLSEVTPSEERPKKS